MGYALTSVELKGGNKVDNKKLLRIPMQFFAESGDNGGTGSSEGSTGSNGDSTSNNPQNNSGSSNGQNNASQGGADNSTLEKLIQSAVDRATNKLGNENKNLKKQLDDIMKQKLTDDERVELERKQEREQFEQEKAQFMAEKNKLYAINALAKAELNIESDKLESLVSLVMGKDETEIGNNVKNLSDLVKTLVASKVEQTFKDNGRNPAGSGNADKKDDKKENSLATQLGKQAHEANQRSAEVLKYYTGG